MIKTIKLEHRDLTVAKLPLGKYAELLKSLKKLPLEIAGFSGQSNDELIAKIPLVIGESWPDIKALFKIATDLTEDELENKIGLAEAVDVFMAIYEVNSYKDIFDKIKKNFGKKLKAMN